MCSLNPSNFRYLTFFNITYIEIEHLDTWFGVLLKVEVGLIMINWLGSMYLFYLFICIRAMHSNLTFLFMNYGGHYYLSMLSRCLIIYQQLGMDPNDDLDTVIYYSNFIRTISLFIAMYILLVFLVERCIATFLVKNYEKSRKIWVSFLILFFFYSFVFASAKSYIHLAFHIVSMFTANIIGYIGIQFCFSYNTKRYKKFYTTEAFAKVHYGLSERFQLAENIKMCKILKKVQISIMFFNIICSFIFMLDHLEVHLTVRYWSYIAFNYLITICGVLGPVSLFLELPEWQRESRRLLNLYFRKNSVKNQPKTTFGEQMIYNDPGQETNIYFNQFNRTTG